MLLGSEFVREEREKLVEVGLEFGESGLGDPSWEEPDRTSLSSSADVVEKPAAPRTPCLIF